MVNTLDAVEWVYILATNRAVDALRHNDKLKSEQYLQLSWAIEAGFPEEIAAIRQRNGWSGPDGEPVRAV